MLKSILRKAGFVVHTPAELERLASDWRGQASEGDYRRLTEKYFGTPLSRSIQNVKLHSQYPDNSEIFRRCHVALLRVEHEYIQELISGLAVHGVPGSFAEFGIFEGDWIDRLYTMTEVAGLADRQIWGFDSFQGLSEPNSIYDSSFWKKGMYAAGRALVEERVKAKERARILLVEGFFSDSLPTAAARTLGDVAFARVDCDIYEPTTEVLNFLSERLAHGAILVFDDWTHDFEHGEGRAFAEWVGTVPHLQFKFLFLGPWDHLHLRVLHRGKPDVF